MKSLSVILENDMTKGIPIIKNGELPACKQCHFYRANSYLMEYGSHYGMCGKFGIKDIITDKILFHYADHCRNTDSLCGNSGTYFKQEPYLWWKEKIHTTKKCAIPIFIVSGMGMMYYCMKQ